MEWQKRLDYKLRSLNAYEYNGPLTNKELFIDRTRELEEAYMVCHRIIRGGIGGVFVVGGRASGKTTFLNKLEESLNTDKVATVFIPLDQGMMKKDKEALFFRTMVDRSIIAMKKADLIGQSVKDKLLNFMRGFSELDIGFEASGLKFLAKWKRDASVGEQFPYFVMKDALDDLLNMIEKKAEGNGGIIFLFDEGNIFTKNRSLLEVIRNVFQFTPKLGLVIAGTLSLLNDVSDVFSPMARFFRKVELGPYPSEEDVYNAVEKPLNKMAEIISNDGFILKGNFRGFVDRIIDLTRKMPMDVNLLSHFAYDEACGRFRKRESVIELRYILNKKVLDKAMNELRGTIEYSEFIESLTTLEIDYLRILANSMYPLSSNELGILVYCNGLEEKLQELSMDDLCTVVEKEKELVTISETTISGIIRKGIKCGIETISTNIMGKPMYMLNDQWLGSYFKIGWAHKLFDIDKGFIPIFGGIIMFRDAISSLMHSIVFPRVSSYLQGATPFKVLSRKGTSRSFRKPRRSGRKYIVVDYQRIADSSNYFYVLNLDAEIEIEPVRKEVANLMATLKGRNLVNRYSVTSLV